MRWLVSLILLFLVVNLFGYTSDPMIVPNLIKNGIEITKQLEAIKKIQEDAKKKVESFKSLKNFRVDNVDDWISVIEAYEKDSYFLPGTEEPIQNLYSILQTTKKVDGEVRDFDNTVKSLQNALETAKENAGVFAVGSIAITVKRNNIMRGIKRLEQKIAMQKKQNEILRKQIEEANSNSDLDAAAKLNVEATKSNQISENANDIADMENEKDKFLALYLEEEQKDVVYQYSKNIREKNVNFLSAYKIRLNSPL